MDDSATRDIDHAEWSYPESAIQLQDTVLGRGAFGEVKVAKWRGISVAAKRLHSLSGGGSTPSMVREDEIQIMESLRKEMDLLSRLRHPNLVLFLGICYDSQHRPTTILTELMPCSLYDVMETYKVRLSLPELLDIALDIASGLEYLHAHDPVIVHRDISSKNILLGGNHAKITDLGQAKVFGSSFLSRQTTMPGAMAYSAPEVLTGKYSTKIDIFSFGVLVIQMCCGDYPRIEKREEQLKRACGAHSALSQLMMSSVSYIPEDRPTSRNLCVDLKNIKANDRYYPPSRRMSPENDLGVLARRWMTDQIDERVRDMKLTLEQTSRMVGVEELRWREEAERVERKEKQLRETQQLLSKSDEEVIRLNAQVETLRKHHEEDARSLETQRQINLTLTSEKSNLEQRIAYIQSVCNDTSTEVLDLRRQIELSKEKNADITRSYENSQEQISRLQRQELELQLQLNMQVELARDMETRLEQALSRWKQEKDLCVKETERCSRLRSNCSELVDKNERLQMALDRQAAKLQLYDSLPMPDEIRERMKTLDAAAKQKSAEADKMLQNFQELKADYDVLMQNNEALNEQIRELNTSLDAAKEDKGRLGKEIDSLKLDRMELQFKYKDLDAAHTILLEESTKKIADLEKKVGDLKDNLRQERSLFAHHMRTLQAEKDKPKVRHEIEKPPDAGAILATLPDIESIAPSDKPVVEEPVEEKVPTEEELAYQRDPDIPAKQGIAQAVESGDVPGILRLIDEHKENEHFAWRGARALREMSVHDETIKSLCIGLRAHETLCRAMDAFKESPMVQAQCLRAIGTLCYKNELVRRQAGECGVVKRIIAAIDAFTGDDTVVMHGLTCITNMTHNSVENRYRFIESNGPDVLLAVMERHRLNAKIQRQACWALLTVAGSDEIARAVADRPLAAAVVDAMVTHRNDSGVQQFAIWAINNLAIAGEDVRRKLKKAGVIEACRIAMETHASDAEVLNQVREVFHTMGVKRNV